MEELTTSRADTSPVCLKSRRDAATMTHRSPEQPPPQPPAPRPMVMIFAAVFVAAMLFNLWYDAYHSAYHGERLTMFLGGSALLILGVDVGKMIGRR